MSGHIHQERLKRVLRVDIVPDPTVENPLNTKEVIVYEPYYVTLDFELGTYERFTFDHDTRVKTVEEQRAVTAEEIDKYDVEENEPDIDDLQRQLKRQRAMMRELLDQLVDNVNSFRPPNRQAVRDAGDFSGARKRPRP